LRAEVIIGPLAQLHGTRDAVDRNASEVQRPWRWPS
jgi:hypothetical protein